ncbi:unnamed protein product [Rhizoctonia solani]|uniref:Peptidase C14 caspase domain-containing protein n=1 Tax=Rhizoctonia solani TaxID=456999 RepID=A0A8H2WWN6_9AGAM|nr:unnamed protein product [Rhizoctonia solani]
MPIIPLLFSSRFASDITTSVKAHEELLKQDVSVGGTTLLVCICGSELCVERYRPHVYTLSQTDLSYVSIPDVHWYRLIQVIVTVVIVLLALGLVERITRDLRRVHHSQVDAGRAMPETEVSTLIGTRVPSTATLHTLDASNYQTYQSVGPTAVHTPDQSPRRSIKLVVELTNPSGFILEEHDRHIPTSPMNSPESFAKIFMDHSRNDIRRQASAAVSKPDLIGSSNTDRDIVKSRTLKSTTQQDHTFENRTQAQQDSSKNPPLGQTNGLRAQTAPCIKYRSASLIKKFTNLISTKNERILILGVAMSWDGIGDGSREILPGPPHDIKWLESAFDGRKNFPFKSLLDSHATLEEVHGSLKDMHLVAGENDILMLYFSGHGGGNDSFELYNPASPNNPSLLDATILNQWIGEFRSETRKLPVYIIFDFCRPDLVTPKTELNDGVHIIWACSPMQSALDLGLNDPYNHLPRSCFLLALILAIDDLSEGCATPVVQRFTERMKELVRVIRGVHCFKTLCGFHIRLGGKFCTHNTLKRPLPFQVFSLGGVEMNSDLSAVVVYVASRFPLHVKRAADQVSKDHWVLYFNPSYMSANRRPLNSRNHRLGLNLGTDNTVRNMTIPVMLLRF